MVTWAVCLLVWALVVAFLLLVNHGIAVENRKYEALINESEKPHA